MTKNTQYALLEWFYSHKRDMPWRDNPTPYRVWISEMMLQQTTVATVHGFFLRFMEKFPDLSDLAIAEEEEVLKMWAGLGYYSRARNVLKTAKILQDESNFPQCLEDLKALPGIGSYTAAAISSIAFNQRAALVDTNVDRVLGRFFGLDRSDKLFNKILFNRAEELMKNVDAEDIWAWNQSLMELGALICKSKIAECEICPCKEECFAKKLDDPISLPGEKRKSKINEVEEFVCVIYKDDQVVLAKITDGTKRKGLYDFPVSKEGNKENSHTMSYRISNNKVKRFVNVFYNNHYELKDDEIFVDKCELLSKYPLISPCAKYIKSKILHKGYNIE